MSMLGKALPVGTLAAAATVLLAGAPRASAQIAEDLVGTWERVDTRDAAGIRRQPPAPVTHLILGADGRFAHVAVPADRPAVSGATADMSREELLSLFGGVTAVYGTWTVEDGLLTRTAITHTHPAMVGSELVQRVRMVGDTLVLSASDLNDQTQARFIRVR